MEQKRSMMIKNLMPGLVERGKIKIGRKGEMRTSKGGKEFQMPQKLDHFLVTTLQRDNTGNFEVDTALHEKIGDAPKEIPIRLLFDDIELNFQSRYACYIGRTLFCSGDGEQARQADAASGAYKDVPCTCERIVMGYDGRDKCKFNGTLSVMIDGAAGVGGVWKFRTTSYNTIVGLMSSLALIKRVTGGILAGIPLTLTVSPKTVTAPDGKIQTIFVVGLEYKGTPEELQAVGYEAALSQANHHARIGHVEEEARRLLLPAPGQVFPDEDTDEIVDEFYPEQAVITDADAPPRPSRNDEPEDSDDVLQRAMDISERDNISTDEALKLAREEQDVEAEAVVQDLIGDPLDIPDHLKRNDDSDKANPPINDPAQQGPLFKDPPEDPAPEEPTMAVPVIVMGKTASGAPDNKSFGEQFIIAIASAPDEAWLNELLNNHKPVLTDLFKLYPDSEAKFDGHVKARREALRAPLT